MISHVMHYSNYIFVYFYPFQKILFSFKCATFSSHMQRL